MWWTKAVGPVGAVSLVDGPHGVRMPTAASTGSLDLSATAQATCFPPAVALAQTWDPDLVEQVGAALGGECLAHGVNVLLGPGMNIKRDPRCGRNFEYFSEDPLLTGVLAAAWVRGLQSTGVGACPKHFAANNAETDRMRVSSDVDMRTLREIYLRAFQHVVEQAEPWLMMCSYNRINGVYAAENHWLLTEVLRQEWGFEGVVVSDWGAVRDRAAALAAGVDLAMPGAGGASDSDIVAAVVSGALAQSAVDGAARRVAELSAKATRQRRCALDAAQHHAFAREVAGRAIVLLQNDGGLLPLDEHSTLAVIGELAQNPAIQGGGSSHVNPTRVDRPVDELRRLLGARQVTFAPGYASDATDSTVLHETATRAAAAADTAVVFLGLPPSAESEGWDRDHIDLPAHQLELLRAVVEAQPRTVAVLSHGGAVGSGVVAEMAPAVLDAALLGQGGGGAIADVLLGRVNPSGRLAETVPNRLCDAPSYLTFPGEAGHTLYGERVFVGYRGYDAAERDVAFPFGHGLSYTGFHYSDPSVEPQADQIAVQTRITNTGALPGREVVQVYAGLPSSAVSRPPRWLVGFTTVALAGGEHADCEIHFPTAQLAYWHTGADRWVVEGGDYSIWVGASSRDLRLQVTVHLDGDEVRAPLTLESTFAEVLSHPEAGRSLLSAFAGMMGDAPAADAIGVDLLRLMAQIPIERAVAFTGGAIRREDLRALLRSAGESAQP
ncbi:beta-glucosidase family protein [Mycobacterium sp. IDR2000157661]|uniref:beta-glucosidase family protein n=1 Tax=Mycobacterium sp. IDR2000157661 TaxID=2867005 RepID=UPI001EEE13EA|nr:beta-glucosidase [Mycobacterium sp. IDR2000157661]ULE35592.1 beta-glucosidase [Mycobacterium sp. IDR2000157661]